MQGGLQRVPHPQESPTGAGPLKATRETRRETLRAMQKAWRAIQKHITPNCCHFNKDGTPIKIVGVQVGIKLLRRGPRAQNLCSLCAPKSRRPYANTRARTRNATCIKQTAIATPTTVPEGTGWVTLANQLGVKNIK